MNVERAASAPNDNLKSAGDEALKSLGNQQDRNEIIERLRRLRPDGERRWGRMTPHQAVCHLSDSFRSATGEMHVEFAGTLLHRTLLKWFALRVPLQWPTGVRTRPEVDQEKGGTRPVEFVRDVQDLEKLVERFTRAGRDFRWNVHPLFGNMAEAEWLRWGYLHMDHHLRQFGV
ncbi:MAG TPA: DUF1569 domain-containing protein [Pyrinomonadaceae bacterium]|nr:DUF1569 domain-containing protein [Pyrinomonadaceae bacterium]